MSSNADISRHAIETEKAVVLLPRDHQWHEVDDNSYLYNVVTGEVIGKVQLTAYRTEVYLVCFRDSQGYVQCPEYIGRVAAKQALLRSLP